MALRDVLVLNSDYQPLNVCSMRRALSLVVLDKAEVVTNSPAPLRTVTGELIAPSILRMRYQVKRPLPQLRLSRHSVLARDGYTCQYCGSKKELTIDHIMPRWRGGGNTWDNLVACCRRCNLKKGDKTPQQANMQLRTTPRRPKFTPSLSLPMYLKARGRDEWQDFLPQMEGFSRFAVSERSA